MKVKTKVNTKNIKALLKKARKRRSRQRRSQQIRNQQRRNGPNPITFDGKNGYDSEVKYSQDEDTGFGFKIEISSDMKIPKY